MHGASFDPQGNGPDKVTFLTDFTRQDFLFSDGAFTRFGGENAQGNTGSLFVISGVPEPSSGWLLTAGVGALLLHRRRARGQRR